MVESCFRLGVGSLSGWVCVVVLLWFGNPVLMPRNVCWLNIHVALSLGGMIGFGGLITVGARDNCAINRCE